MAELGPFLRDEPAPGRSRIGLLLLVAACLAGAPAVVGESFRLPTDNRAVLDPGEESLFFAPTPGRTWTAGQFGCVRSEGTQFHEGIDILALRKDRRGEPLDEVRAAAAGEVAYANRKPGLSNFGNYLVLKHRVDGVQVYTLYAHLREIRRDLSPGVAVKAGEKVGVVGRTTNTRTPITRDRAHLHFEIDLFLNPSFSRWLAKHEPDARDDHGPWNGRNLVGVDPAEVFRAQKSQGSRFDFLEYLRSQREMCRVLLARTSFPWLARYPGLVQRNPIAEREGKVAYELSLNYNGLPFRSVPRARSEIKGSVSTRVLAVDEAELARHPCGKLVFKRGQAWVLTARGHDLLDLLCH